MFKKNASGDPSLRHTPFNPFAEALAQAGLLHTKKGGKRKNQHMRCKSNCGGFVEFLGRYKDVGFCDKCGDDLSSTVPHYSYLRNRRSA